MVAPERVNTRSKTKWVPSTGTGRRGCAPARLQSIPSRYTRTMSVHQTYRCVDLSSSEGWSMPLALCILPFPPQALRADYPPPSDGSEILRAGCLPYCHTVGDRLSRSLWNDGKALE